MPCQMIKTVQISDSQRHGGSCLHVRYRRGRTRWPLISASFLGNGIMCGEIESVRRNRNVNVSVNSIVWKNAWKETLLGELIGYTHASHGSWTFWPGQWPRFRSRCRGRGAGYCWWRWRQNVRNLPLLIGLQMRVVADGVGVFVTWRIKGTVYKYSVLNCLFTNNVTTIGEMNYLWRFPINRSCGVINVSDDDWMMQYRLRYP